MRFVERIWWLYVPGTVLVAGLAFWFGTRAARAGCRVDDTNCDMISVEGAVWAFLTIVVCVGLLVLGELLVGILRGNRSRSTRA